MHKRILSNKSKSPDKKSLNDIKNVIISTYLTYIFNIIKYLKIEVKSNFLIKYLYKDSLRIAIQYNI